MRVLIINEYYYPNMIGGTENSVKLLAEGLVKNGHEVAVVCGNNEEALRVDTINGVKVYKINLKKYLLPHINKLNLKDKIINKLIEINNPFIKKDLVYILNEYKPDVVHTNNLYGFSSYVWNIVKDHDIPIVHTLRDYELLAPIKQLPRLSSVLGKERTKIVNTVTSPSKITLQRFIENNFFSCSEKCVIHNAIDLDILETKKIIENKRNLNTKKITFLYVGMLEEIKGIKNLLVAFTSIENANIKLSICGKGALEYLVKDYSNKDNRIHYHGQLDKSDLQNIYLSCDVMIVPSIWEEPFGRVVIEANQYGLPVIGSNRGGIQEIIDTIDTGLLFQYDSIEALRNAIIKFSDRELICEYYDNIIKNIEIYSLQKQIDKFLLVYQDCIGVNNNHKNVHIKNLKKEEN